MVGDIAHEIVERAISFTAPRRRNARRTIEHHAELEAMLASVDNGNGNGKSKEAA